MWLQTAWSFEEDQHAQKGQFPSLELAAACGVVSTCRSLPWSVQEPGFYPGRCTAIATPCPPQGKICLPKLFWKGWLLWKQKQQWVKLKQCPVLVLTFSCSEQLDCKAGDAGYQISVTVKVTFNFHPGWGNLPVTHIASSCALGGLMGPSHAPQ